MQMRRIGMEYRIPKLKILTTGLCVLLTKSVVAILENIESHKQESFHTYTQHALLLHK